MAAAAEPRSLDVAALARAAAEAIARHADELNRLDAAIGDADHGSNLRRGFEATAARADDLRALPLPQALHEAGMTLVMTVGGASGPLAGTFLIALGRALADDAGGADGGGFAPALALAVNAVAARGRSGPGQKTVLDVLYPLARAAAEGRPAGELAGVAEAACRATMPMRAMCGRAAHLGERSVGHVDPGARSAAILAAVVADHVCGREARP